ncbi:MAG: tyrosine-type recombinase/integrase [Verrucomicrobia bacterium]|nr:tyrosine-type recombinase/integrase [Verrucomicrobiota bacterium]
MTTPELTPWLQRFFSEYLSAQRNVSHATITAYRDTFRLLLNYLRKAHRRCSHTLPLEILSSDTVLRFLDDLERQRGNTIRTRNARLAAIRSFVHYLSDWLGPELPVCVARILAIPFKRYVQVMSGFLNRQEVEAILSATTDTWTGRRDHLLFLLLYNTGARISEVLALRVMDIGAGGKQVQVLGKGRKQRSLPLWRQTQRGLRQWIRENRFNSESPLLPNRFGQRLTRAGAAYQLKQLVRRASLKLPALRQRSISPHTFRHSMAMGLLEGGITTEVIALFLGHETPKTTHLYMEASLAMKKQALEKVSSPKSKRSSFRPDDKLLRFLENL